MRSRPAGATAASVAALRVRGALTALGRAAHAPLAPLAPLAALAALALFVAALAALAAPAAAQRSIVLEELRSEAVVERDGALLVTETLRPRFSGEWNGVRRVLDRQHTTAAGRSARLDIEVLGATGERGEALRTDIERSGGRVEVSVWVPDARDRTATVTLRYRVRGILRHFAADSTGVDAPAVDYDELYWQVTGTEWEVPIERASGRVTLPAGTAPLQAAAYRGTAASTQPAAVRMLADGVAVDDVGPLPSGHGLTLAVAWPAGVVPGPSPGERSAPVAVGARVPRAPAHPLAYSPVLLALAIAGLCHRAWRRRGRDPSPRAITVHWEPPPGLSPAEAGTLIDHRPELHDIVSTLVDLAVRGYVRIEERGKPGLLGLGRGKDYRFHLVRPRHEWDELADHERRFLRGLFAHSGAATPATSLAGVPVLGGLVKAIAGEETPPPPDAIESVRLADLENKFYKELPGIRDAILDSLVRKGHYRRRPDHVRARWFVLAAVVAAGGVATLAVGTSAATTGTGLALAVSIGVGLLAGALVVAIYGSVMPARTVLGARAREAALGFRRFLERVESPRYRRMITTPELFETYLPFAMAFRCEERWAKAFEGLLTEPPDWYSGTGPFHASSFARSMNSMAAAAGSSMASSPSSSGSGGGGSVGGGSGGGGGGGF